jgi:uncharacterized protein YbaP (TraB family)
MKTVRHRIIVILLALSCFALPAAWGAERGALFKVQGSGHTMYLFGTMHVGVPAFYPLEPRIAQAVAGASTLVLEIDNDSDPAAMADAMRRHGMLAPGSALYEKMTPRFRQRLDAVLGRAGIPPAAAGAVRPWLVAVMLALAEYGALGYDPALAVDAHLAQLARDSGVPVAALETVDGQLALFGRLSDAEQLVFLEETVDLIEKGEQREEVRQIAAAWAGADQAALDAVAHRIETDTTLSGRFMQKVLLEERNAGMAAKLAQLLAQKDNSVAAVGVLHLVGTRSVPKLLQERGITVERVY